MAVGDPAHIGPDLYELSIYHISVGAQVGALAGANSRIWASVRDDRAVDLQAVEEPAAKLVQAEIALDHARRDGKPPAVGEHAVVVGLVAGVAAHGRPLEA